MQARSREALVKRLGGTAPPSRDKEKFASLPLHYLFDEIPVGDDR